MIQALRNFFVGIVLGLANIIPGVSGGTMAIVFDVYEKLIAIISFNIKKIFKEWKFILPLGLGMVFGIFLFSSFLTYLLEKFPIQTNVFFIALILGSLPLLIKKINKEDFLKTKISSSLSFIIALAIMIIMFFVSPTHSPIVYEQINFVLFFRLVISLAFVAIAMIIPGVSGSFLMMVLGIYTSVIAAVSEMRIPLLIPIAVGVLLGLLSGASLVRFLLDKVKTQTYSAILALVIMSVIIIFPFEALSNFSKIASTWNIIFLLITSLVVFIFGFFLSYLSSREKN